MGLKKLANNRGYTLMELIIAMSMVLTISAVAIPNYTRYIASTREKVCIMNRQTILNEYQLYCIIEPEITLSEYLSFHYAEVVDHICPYEGIYTAGGSGEMVTLTCSKHHEILTASHRNDLTAINISDDELNLTNAQNPLLRPQ